nr:MAG TPA: hypothetical protein [Caudoviricetes sp.]
MILYQIYLIILDRMESLIQIIHKLQKYQDL